jgi:hypothetical protein
MNIPAVVEVLCGLRNTSYESRIADLRNRGVEMLGIKGIKLRCWGSAIQKMFTTDLFVFHVSD